MLSISTIASAIADASISTDPSQLAAMIIELSKKGRTRHLPNSVGPDGNSSEENPAGEHVRRFFCCVILALFLRSIVFKKKNHSNFIDSLNNII